MNVHINGRFAFAELLRQIARDIEGGQITIPPVITVIGVGDTWEAHVRLTYAGSPPAETEHDPENQTPTDRPWHEADKTPAPDEPDE